MSERPGLRAAVRALRHRNFRLFWFGALVSNTGTWMQLLTVPYVIHQLTDSGTWVGAVAFLQMMPNIAIAPFAGPLADRVPRRTILLVTQSMMAVVAFGFALAWWADVDSPYVYLALAMVYGLIGGVMTPSWQAFVSELVPRGDLLNAVTLNSTQFQATRAVGPALGGMVLALAGPGLAFLLNATSFVAVLVALLAIRVPRLVADDPPPWQIRADLVSTRNYISQRPAIMRCFKTVVVTALLGQPLIHLIVVFAEEVFAAEGFRLGLMASSIGIGAVLFFPLVAGWGQTMRRSQLVSVALVTYGLAITGFGLSPWYPAALACLAIVGASHLTTASTLNTVIQLQVDEHMRGKVIALYLMTISTGLPIGSLVMGVLYDVIGPRITMAGAGVCITVIAIWLVSTGRFGAMDEAFDTEDQPVTRR